MTQCPRVEDLNKIIFTFEENSTEHDNLKNALTDDVFPHLRGNQIFEFGVRFSLEKLVCGRLSGKGKRGHGVHDEVDPQHLDRAQR